MKANKLFIRPGVKAKQLWGDTVLWLRTSPDIIYIYIYVYIYIYRCRHMSTHSVDIYVFQHVLVVNTCPPTYLFWVNETPCESSLWIPKWLDHKQSGAPELCVFLTTRYVHMRGLWCPIYLFMFVHVHHKISTINPLVKSVREVNPLNAIANLGFPT